MAPGQDGAERRLEESKARLQAADERRKAAVLEVRVLCCGGGAYAGNMRCGAELRASGAGALVSARPSVVSWSGCGRCRPAGAPPPMSPFYPRIRAPFQVEALLGEIEAVHADMCARSQQHAEHQRRYVPGAGGARTGAVERRQACATLTTERGRLERSELRFAELQRTRMLQLDAQIATSLGEGRESWRAAALPSVGALCTAPFCECAARGNPRAAAPCRGGTVMSLGLTLLCDAHQEPAHGGNGSERIVRKTPSSRSQANMPALGMGMSGVRNRGGSMVVSADGAAARGALEPPSPQNWVQQQQREQQQAQQQQQARAKQEEEQRQRENRQRLVRKMQEEEREMHRQQQQQAGRWEQFLTQNLTAAASTESAYTGPAAPVSARRSERVAPLAPLPSRAC